jgi:hypothetical protein
MFAGDCVPMWPAATSKHLSDVPSTLIRIAELHVLFFRVENRDKRVLTRLVCHSSLCDCTVVAECPQFLFFVVRQFALPMLLRNLKVEIILIQDLYNVWEPE